MRAPPSVSDVSPLSRADLLLMFCAAVVVDDEDVAASVAVGAVMDVVESAFGSSLVSSARCLNCLRFLLGRKTTCGSAFVSADADSMILSTK